jgi:hypothetical protein
VEQEAGQKGIMDTNLHQHASLNAGLSAYTDYIGDVLQDRASYSSERFLKLISSFDSALAEHLSDEIKTIADLGRYDINWDRVNKAITDIAVKNVDQVSSLSWAGIVVFTE